MSYADPSRYVTRYGLAETAQLLADEQGLITEALLGQALTGELDGTPDERTAVLAALERLTRQLESASEYMDGYLGVAVQLPLAPGIGAAGSLEECCAALARCSLADDADNATERMDKCCDQWRAWLRDVAAGRVKLVGLGGETPPGTSGRIRTGRIGSAYCWDRFGGVR